jgi:hypothetical protein
VIHTFTATILGDMGPHKWDMVRVPSSTEMLGTGKAVKIRATVDGIEVSTGLLPSEGNHLMPIKSEIGRALGKSAGDQVTVQILEKLS